MLSHSYVISITQARYKRGFWEVGAMSVGGKAQKPTSLISTRYFLKGLERQKGFCVVATHSLCIPHRRCQSIFTLLGLHIPPPQVLDLSVSLLKPYVLSQPQTSLINTTVSHMVTKPRPPLSEDKQAGWSKHREHVEGAGERIWRGLAAVEGKSETFFSFVSNADVVLQRSTSLKESWWTHIENSMPLHQGLFTQHHMCPYVKTANEGNYMHVFHPNITLVIKIMAKKNPGLCGISRCL